MWMFMVHVTTKSHVFWAALWGHMDVQGLCKAGPAPPLGSAEELALMVSEVREQFPSFSCCKVAGQGPNLQHLGDWALHPMWAVLETWPQCYEHRRAGPAPLPGKAGELALVVWARESWQISPRPRSRALSSPSPTGVSSSASLHVGR